MTRRGSKYAEVEVSAVKLYIIILQILLELCYVIIYRLSSNQTSICHKTARRTEKWHTAQNTGIVKRKTLV